MQGCEERRVVAHVLLMNAPLRRPNEIHVRVRGENGQLLAGAAIHWTEDGADRGGSDSSDGHMTLHPSSEGSIVEVTVSFEGREQKQKLAIEQTTCDIVYPNGGRAKEEAAPLVPNSSSERSVWKTPVVVAAVVTAAAAVLVGWWQYGSSSGGKVGLVVYVKDLSSGRPVPRARVALQSVDMPPPKLADDLGRAEFQLAKGKEKTFSVSARAQGYEDATISVTASEVDYQVELPMTAKPVAVAASAGSRPGAPAFPMPSGTWQVQASGDLGLKRVSGGTFEFSPVLNGLSTVRARLTLDDTAVTLDGQVSRQNNRLFFKFKAQSDASSWSGEGQFAMTAGNAMHGALSDGKKAQVAVQLRKP